MIAWRALLGIRRRGSSAPFLSKQSAGSKKAMFTSSRAAEEPALRLLNFCGYPDEHVAVAEQSVDRLEGGGAEDLDVLAIGRDPAIPFLNSPLSGRQESRVREIRPLGSDLPPERRTAAVAIDTITETKCGTAPVLIFQDRTQAPPAQIAAVKACYPRAIAKLNLIEVRTR